MKKTILISLFLIVWQFVVSGQSVFTHTAQRSNITEHWTTLDHAAVNNVSEALVFVTPTQFPHNHPIGVRYFGRRWTIINEDRIAMSEGARFNLLVVSPGENAFIHIARRPSIIGHITLLDHPRLNGHPEARLLVTQRFEWSGPFNNCPIGVYYERTYNQWAIINEDRSIPIPPDAQFNVLISNQVFEVVATAPSGNAYFFSRAATDGVSNALLFVTQKWASVYNPQNIGVRYQAGRWGVQNPRADLIMPANTRFFILAIRPTYRTVSGARIESLCPTRRTRVDTDFGRPPRITFQTDLVINSSRTQLNTEINFKAEEPVSDFSTVEQTFNRTLWSAPAGMVISHVSSPTRYNTSFLSRVAGAEYGICNDGEINIGRVRGSILRTLHIIGDTGGTDISNDDNCHCDTQIRLIEFSPITLVLIPRLF